MKTPQTRCPDPLCPTSSERPKASPSEADYRTVLAGTGWGRLDGRHGDGHFTIDLAAARDLDPAAHADESGTVRVVHDLPRDVAGRLGALPRTIEARVTPAGEAWFTVSSRAEADGTGSLLGDAHGDLDASKITALEDVNVLSRWRADGAGRADVTISGGDLPASAALVEAVECWGADFQRAYYSDSVEFEPTEGDSAACVYSAP